MIGTGEGSGEEGAGGSQRAPSVALRGPVGDPRFGPRPPPPRLLRGAESLCPRGGEQPSGWGRRGGGTGPGVSGGIVPREPEGADAGVPGGGPGLGARGCGQAGCRGWEQARKERGVGALSVPPHGWAQHYPGL